MGTGFDSSLIGGKPLSDSAAADLPTPLVDRFFLLLTRNPNL